MTLRLCCTAEFVLTHFRAVLLAFSRDVSIPSTAAVAPHPAMTVGSRLMPGSGVLPFQGLCAYLAPLCYLYSSPAAMYPVWREMYCRYWCHLHTLNTSSAPSAGLPVLCRTFLDLLQVSQAHASTPWPWLTKTSTAWTTLPIWVPTPQQG